MTFPEIQQLDAGYYWTEDEQTYPFRGQGIQIPSLESVIAAHSQMKFNIEIKQQSPSIAAPLCHLIRTYDLTDRTLVASFHEVSMDEFRAACPEVATSMVESEIRLFYILNRLYLGGLFNPPGQAFQVPEYSGDLLVLSPRFVEGAHARGIAVHPWTINDQAEMQRFLEMGADGIITDRPDLMLELFNN
jgi:glycerophosphoryl diester phosphodiesterase